VPEPASPLRTTPRAPTLLAEPTYVLAKLGRIAQRLTQESIADQGLLLPHFSVLATLNDFGPLAQHEVAARLGLNRSHLVAYVDELESRNAVRRERDPDDRRRQVVSLTQTGRTLLTELKAPISTAQDRFLAVLTEQERAILLELLARLLAHANQPARPDRGALAPDDR
jgi:DNA-binding MarR family transcriptional regulator